MTFQTEWAFDTKGKPVTSQDTISSSSDVAIRVRVITHAQVIADAETLRPQVEALYTRRLATITDPPVTAVAAGNKIFTPQLTTEDVSVREQTAKSLEPRNLAFLAYCVANPERSSELVGFTRVYEERFLNGIIGSAIIVDPNTSNQTQEALETALVYASQSAGEAMSRSLLTEKRVAAELSGKPAPASQTLYRGLSLATDVTKKLFASHGFIDEPQRLEMSKDLAHIDMSEPVFPDDIDVKSLDLSDHTAMQQFYDVLKAAFGSQPPSFEAWKIHYAQQPRFAPALSFFAQRKTDGAVVAVIAIERVVEGEGGSDEVNRMFETSKRLQAHYERVNAAAMGEAEPIDTVDDALPSLLSATSTTALVFPPDFDEKKAAIVQRATVGYVCGAATSVKYRGKGLASGLLRRAFQVAARETPLRKIALGTDAYNTSAVHAYERAGMVVSKRISSGYIVVKHIA